MQAYLLVAIEL